MCLRNIIGRKLPYLNTQVGAGTHGWARHTNTRVTYDPGVGDVKPGGQGSTTRGIHPIWGWEKVRVYCAGYSTGSQGGARTPYTVYTQLYPGRGQGFRPTPTPVTNSRNDYPIYAWHNTPVVYALSAFHAFENHEICCKIYYYSNILLDAILEKCIKCIIFVFFNRRNVQFQLSDDWKTPLAFKGCLMMMIMMSRSRRDDSQPSTTNISSTTRTNYNVAWYLSNYKHSCHYAHNGHTK